MARTLEQMLAAENRKSWPLLKRLQMICGFRSTWPSSASGCA